jgi:hypothetical protein
VNPSKADQIAAIDQVIHDLSALDYSLLANGLVGSHDLIVTTRFQLERQRRELEAEPEAVADRLAPQAWRP